MATKEEALLRSLLLSRRMLSGIAGLVERRARVSEERLGERAALARQHRTSARAVEVQRALVEDAIAAIPGRGPAPEHDRDDGHGAEDEEAE